MFDYIFLQIMKAESTDMLDAIIHAIDTVDCLSETQAIQLRIVAGMQKDILLLTDICQLEQQSTELNKELANGYKNIIDNLTNGVKVTVTPIVDETEE